MSAPATATERRGPSRAAVLAVALLGCGDVAKRADAGVDDDPTARRCATDADCDDEAFCNGTERCRGGRCRAGASPDCDDGIDCTIDRCNELHDLCSPLPDHAACGDLEYCYADRGCDESPDCGRDLDCEDGYWCNGEEDCDLDVGRCRGMPLRTCEDRAECTEEVCDDASRSCVMIPFDARCDDGNTCDGAERCTSQGCREVEEWPVQGFSCVTPEDEAGACAGGACVPGQVGLVLVTRIRGVLDAPGGWLVVGAAPDLDGDGRADLVRANALWEENGRVDAVSSADAAVLWSARGPREAMLGGCLALLDDQDDDGVDDIVACAQGLDGVVLLSGATGGLIRTLRQESGSLGRVVARLDDLDGDGHSEIVTCGTGPKARAGRCVVFGRGGSIVTEVPSPAGARWFGTSVAATGDLMGRGGHGFVVGAPGDRMILGSVYVIDAASGDILRTHDGGAEFGTGVAGLPDMDGDRVAEYAVGGSTVGPLIVYSGRDGDVLASLAPTYDESRLGRVLTTGFDADGDGRAELVATAPGRFVAWNATLGERVSVVDGDPPHDRFADRVAAIGDASGDGEPDLAVVVPSVGPDGEIWIFRGQ